MMKELKYLPVRLIDAHKAVLRLSGVCLEKTSARFLLTRYISIGGCRLTIWLERLRWAAAVGSAVRWHLCAQLRSQQRSSGAWCGLRIRSHFSSGVRQLPRARRLLIEFPADFDHSARQAGRVLWQQIVVQKNLIRFSARHSDRHLGSWCEVWRQKTGIFLQKSRGAPQNRDSYIPMSTVIFADCRSALACGRVAGTSRSRRARSAATAIQMAMCLGRIFSTRMSLCAQLFRVCRRNMHQNMHQKTHRLSCVVLIWALAACDSNSVESAQSGPGSLPRQATDVAGEGEVTPDVQGETKYPRKFAGKGTYEFKSNDLTFSANFSAAGGRSAEDLDGQYTMPGTIEVHGGSAFPTGCNCKISSSSGPVTVTLGLDPESLMHSLALGASVPVPLSCAPKSSVEMTCASSIDLPVTWMSGFPVCDGSMANSSPNLSSASGKYLGLCGGNQVKVEWLFRGSD